MADSESQNERATDGHLAEDGGPATDATFDIAAPPTSGDGASVGATRPPPEGTYDFRVGEGHVGARVLDIISSAMYSNALDVLREYIQNAYDGGARAVRITVGEDEVLVLDDGNGLSPRDMDEARKVAISRKRSPTTVGFRGIGLYSSFSACRALEVLSRPEAGGGPYMLRIDYAAIRAAEARATEVRAAAARAAEEAQGAGASDAAAGTDATPLLEMLARHTAITDADAATFAALTAGDTRWRTVVRIVRPTGAFLARVSDDKVLASYLTAAVPLDFAAEFTHRTAVREVLAHHVRGVRTIEVTVRTPDGKSTQFLQAAARDVLPPIVRVLSDRAGTPVAVLWACVNRARSVVKPESVEGFQLRYKGFGIGDRSLCRLYWPSTSNRLLYRGVTGEVHVLDTSLTPTADRGNFEDSPARDQLFTLLEQEFKSLNRWMDKWRKALLNVERGGEPDKAALYEQGMTALHALARQLPPDARTDIHALLDAPGAAVLAARAAEAQGGAAAPSSPGTRGGDAREHEGPPTAQDGRGPAGAPAAASGEGRSAAGAHPAYRADGANPGLGDEDDEEDEPALRFADLLLDLDLRWPADASAVFDTLDGALTDVLPEAEYRACARSFRNRLARRAQRIYNAE